MTPLPATVHFCERVRQRIGSDICADALATEILRAKDRVVTPIEPGGMLQRGGKRKAKRLRA